MTHWKKLTNPNYLGEYAIPPGQDLIVTISYVAEEEVTGNNGRKENEVVAHFSDFEKPMILNKTNLKTIQMICHSPYIEEWTGHQIQIYYDPTVKFGRETVGGLRIRPFKPKVICPVCNKVIMPLKHKNGQIIESNQILHQFGMCAECESRRRNNAT